MESAEYKIGDCFQAITLEGLRAAVLQQPKLYQLR